MATKKRGARTAPRTSGRVPRNTLTRSRVIEAALVLIDAEGVSAVTMPSVAAHLGVGTMSLYRHVENKDDLLDGVAEHVLGRVEVPAGAPDDWEGRVVGYLRSLRSQAVAHPALSSILAERGLTVGPVFDQLEQTHGVLRAARFSDADAVRTFYSLFTYVFGFVIWELPRVHQQPAASYTKAWNDAFDELDPDSYPNLHALRAELTTVASTDQFEYGLEHLIESLRRRGTRSGSG